MNKRKRSLFSGFSRIGVPEKTFRRYTRDQALIRTPLTQDIAYEKFI